MLNKLTICGNLTNNLKIALKCNRCTSIVFKVTYIHDLDTNFFIAPNAFLHLKAFAPIIEGQK